jgi:hypothetical protein
MYARGILFGKMKYELGDHSYVRCPESGLVADLEFKTKGYFGGTYNAIGGFIKDTKTDKNLFELSGLWNEEMYIKDLTVFLPFQTATISGISNQTSSLTDCGSRLARRHFSSMPHMPKKRHQKLDHLKSRVSENRRDYGTA